MKIFKKEEMLENGFVSINTIGYNIENLIDIIQNAQCPEEFHAQQISYFILKDVCRITNTNFDDLLIQIENKDGIFEIVEQLFELAKFYWIGIKYSYKDLPKEYVELSNIDVCFNLNDFFNKWEESNKLEDNINKEFEDGKITEEEYDNKIEKNYEETGCKFYHTNIFNEDFVSTYSDNLILDDNNNAAEFTIYNYSKTIADNEFLNLINNSFQYLSINYQLKSTLVIDN